MAKIAGIHNFQTAHASYWVSSNFTASSTVPINYDSKEYDVENCVTTSATAWKYTAKYAGVYEVEAFTYGTTSCNFLVYKNGALYGQLNFNISSSNGNSCVLPVLMAVGDYIDVRPNMGSTCTGGAINGGVNTNKVAVKRIGF
jgi:hypothetical protein